jgi:hypothetical protein
VRPSLPGDRRRVLHPPSLRDPTGVGFEQNLAQAPDSGRPGAKWRRRSIWQVVALQLGLWGSGSGSGQVGLMLGAGRAAGRV